jgi:hypothetical protein
MPTASTATTLTTLTAAAEAHPDRRRPSVLTAQASSCCLEGEVGRGGSGQCRDREFEAGARQYPSIT